MARIVIESSGKTLMFSSQNHGAPWKSIWKHGSCIAQR